MSDRPRPARYLVPLVPEVALLAGASEHVLLACGSAEDVRGDRAVHVSTLVDPCTMLPHAVVGFGLPRPLADRVALRALGRLTAVLRPALTVRARWTGPEGETMVPFRALLLDAADLSVLRHAAASLTHPKRSREGALGDALAALCDDGAPDDARHPAALSCLLAVLVPVDDHATADLYERARDAGDEHVLDGAGRDAHRVVGERVLARMRPTPHAVPGADGHRHVT